MEIKNSVFLSLGSNLGDKLHHLQKAIELIQKNIGDVVKKSSVYESSAWGYESNNSYYNCCLEVSSVYSAQEILSKSQAIEREMGREKTVHYSDRVIDIDILFFNDEIIEENNLIIPHKYLSKRDFVLFPLNEIEPHKIHCKHFLTIHQLLLNFNHLHNISIVCNLNQ